MNNAARNTVVDLESIIRNRTGSGSGGTDTFALLTALLVRLFPDDDKAKVEHLIALVTAGSASDRLRYEAARKHVAEITIEPGAG